MPLHSKNLTINLEQLSSKIPRKVVQKAMAIAAIELLRDAVMELPTTPIDTGRLRGSGSVHSGGKYITSSPDLGLAPIDGQPNKDKIPSIEKDAIKAVVGFNVEYATVQHERLGPRQEPSAGPKYLETAMMKNGDKYRAIIGNELKKELGKKFRGI